jgi:hypothetical protein
MDMHRRVRQPQSVWAQTVAPALKPATGKRYLQRRASIAVPVHRSIALNDGGWTRNRDHPPEAIAYSGE